MVETPEGATHALLLHTLRSNGELIVDDFSFKKLDENLKDGLATEVMYDATGRVVASRFNNENWNCTTYDDRGRVESKEIADNNGKTGKTVSNNFSYGNNPLKRLVTDGTTTTISEYDFVGNLIKYTDPYGMETFYTYDSLNRLIEKVSDIGTEEWVYNDYSQVIEKKLDDVTYAEVTYDAYGRVDEIEYPEAGQLAYLGTTRDDLERPIEYNWKQSDGTLITEALTRSQSGLILEQEFTQDVTTYTQSYTFDKADRLIAADYGDRQYAYSYTEASECGFANSNKNFNRTSDSLTISGITSTNRYCYDNADKLVSSTQYGSPVYDSHGNTTKLGNLTFGYDISDQNISVTDGWNLMEYARDLHGRVFWTYYTNGGEFLRYNYTSSSSSPSILRNGDNYNIIEKYVSLPGMLLTIKTGVGEEYSIMSSTGNVLAKETGTLKRYDPFGTAITGAEKYGFGGSQLRELDTNFSIPFIQMGARVYIPTLGRFLQVDPIEGGTQNNYVYPVDPINANDFSGKAIPILIMAAGLVVVAAAVLLVAPRVVDNGLDSLGKILGAINTGIRNWAEFSKVRESSGSDEVTKGSKKEENTSPETLAPRPSLKSPQNKLPTEGEYPYIPPKVKGVKPEDVVKAPGRSGTLPGFIDVNGRIWVWDRLHGDHWDVSNPDGSSHKNINPDGSIRF